MVARKSPDNSPAAVSKRWLGTRGLAALAALLLLSVVGLMAGAWVVGTRLTAPAPASLGPPPEGLSAQTVHIPTADGGQLTGWWLPGRPGGGAMLLLHGVRGHRGQMLARARWLQREGVASLLVDMPSHGESSGERIGFGRLEAPAVDTALNWLRRRHPGEHIGAIGVSLGGAALLFAQRQPELDALVLESVYPSIDDAVKDRLTMRLGEPAAQLVAPLLLAQLPMRLSLNRSQLRPLDAIGSVHAPLLIAAGTRDEHTRWPETERLFAQASGDKTLWPVPGAAHQDLHAYDAVTYEEFVGTWLLRQLRKAPA